MGKSCAFSFAFANGIVLTAMRKRRYISQFGTPWGHRWPSPSWRREKISSFCSYDPAESFVKKKRAWAEDKNVLIPLLLDCCGGVSLRIYFWRLYE